MATARLKFDENIARDAVTLARRQNVDVETVADEQLAGAPDEVIAAACSSEGRVLVTLDLDFADVRAYPPAATPWRVPPRVSLRFVLYAARAGRR